MNQPISRDESSSIQTDEIHLERSLVSIPLLLWRRRWLMAGIIAASIFCSVIFILFATPRYTSGARLYVNQSGPRLIGEHRPELALAEGEQFAATQAKLIESMQVLDDAGLHLFDVPSLQNVSNIGKHLRRWSWAEVDKKTQIITVTYLSTDADDAATVANQIVQSYLGFQRAQRQKTATQQLVALKEDSKARVTELAERTAELQELQKRYGVISLSDEYTTVVTDQLAKLSVALSEASIEAMNRQASYDEAARSLNVTQKQLAKFEKSNGVENFAATITEEDSKDRLQMITALQMRLREAERSSGPNHPLVVGYRAQLEQAVMGYVASLKQATLTANAKQKELEKRLVDQQTLANKLTTTAVEFGRLRGEIRRLEKLRDATNDRINEIQVASNVGDLVTIVDAARPERSPTWPNKKRTLGMGGAAGLVLAIGLAFLLEWTNPRVRSPEQVESLLNSRVLGTIPRLPARDIASRYRASVIDPAGLAAEAYRMLRTNLIGRHRGKFKTLAVTSSSPQEGKSTAASNLAVVMAQTGRRVLLVDADMRNPVQHIALHATPDCGLTTVLAGEVQWRDAILTATDRAPDLLPAGPATLDPAGLLNSTAFETFLREVAEVYDYIVIDTPPVSCAADARIIASWCDLSLFVIRADRTNLKACVNSYQALQMVGADIGGLVINDVAISDSRSYGGIDPYYSYIEQRASRQNKLGVQNTNGHSKSDSESVAALSLYPAFSEIDQPLKSIEMDTGLDHIAPAPAKLELLGVGVSSTDYDQVVKISTSWAISGRQGMVDFMPVHGLVTAMRDQQFRTAIDAFDIVAPDGQPVRWGLNRLHSAGLSDRVYGPICMLKLCKAAEENGVGIYLYGGTVDVLSALVERLHREFPKLIISGRDSPPFRTLTEDEDRATIDRINASGAGMLFLGLGCPKQEVFAFDHRNDLRPVQFCVGAAFDLLAGTKRMAPPWMQQTGLEWMYRLVQEPRRLARRYLVTNTIYVWSMGREIVGRSLRGGRNGADSSN